MTYTEEQFLEDVKAEAIALKQHATKEELTRLDFMSLDPESSTACIYGQMTEDCRSPRAARLIEKCCIRFFKNHYSSALLSKGFVAVVDRVNGQKIEDFALDRARLDHFSAIETYIMTPSAKNANLIAFLRDETKELVL